MKMAVFSSISSAAARPPATPFLLSVQRELLVIGRLKGETVSGDRASMGADGLPALGQLLQVFTDGDLGDGEELAKL